MPTLREDLRTHTRQSHMDLDATMGSIRPFESAERYRCYLTGMRRLYEICEGSLAWVNQNEELPQRELELLDAIDRDLESLPNTLQPTPDAGSAQSLPTAGSISENASHPDLATENSPAVMWGEAYVMEGSAMGGKFMYITAQEALPPSFGRNYLKQLSEDAKTRWRPFVAALESHEFSDADREQAIEAAREVFRKASRIFETASFPEPATE